MGIQKKTVNQMLKGVVKKSKREFFRGVFRKIMSTYDETKTSNGTLSCQGFYRSIAGESANKGAYNPLVVRATASDFICDVELTARRVLSKEEYRFFKLLYLDKDKEIAELVVAKSPDNKFNGLKQTVQEKLGFAFDDRGIYPLSKYYKAKDLR